MNKHGYDREPGHRLGKSGDYRHDRFADDEDEKPRRLRHTPYVRTRHRRLRPGVDAGWDTDTSV